MNCYHWPDNCVLKNIFLEFDRDMVLGCASGYSMEDNQGKTKQAHIPGIQQNGNPSITIK